MWQCRRSRTFRGPIALRQLLGLILPFDSTPCQVGFTDELDLICKSCPQKRQTMLFSATMTGRRAELHEEEIAGLPCPLIAFRLHLTPPDEVEDLIKLSLYKPVRLFVDKKTKVC